MDESSAESLRFSRQRRKDCPRVYLAHDPEALKAVERYGWFSPDYQMAHLLGPLPSLSQTNRNSVNRACHKLWRQGRLKAYSRTRAWGKVRVWRLAPRKESQKV